MGNSAGAFAVLSAFVRPGLVVPHAVVPDIGFIDWKQLRQAGVEDVVIDKDNCVTLPHRDHVAPGLESAWSALVSAGFRSILIVSNSAGSSDDPLALNAEHLARVLGQPVLAHPDKKPANGCARQIVDVLQQPKQFDTSFDIAGEGRDVIGQHIAVIGDRITTDIVLASRIDRILQEKGSNRRAIGILTTRVFEKERMGTRLMRSLEMRILARLDKIGILPGQGWRKASASNVSLHKADWQSIAFDQEAARRSAELEAANQSPKDLGQMFAQTLRQLAIVSIRGIGSGLRWTLILIGTTSWHLINHGLYLATRGRVGSPSTSNIALPSWRSTEKATTKGLERETPTHPRSLPLSFTSLYHYRLARSRPLLTERRQPFSTSAITRSTGSGKASSASTAKGIQGKLPLQNKVAFFAALVLLPTCWFGGIALHEWVHMPSKDEVRREEQEQRPFVGPQSAQSPSLTLSPGSAQHGQSTPSAEQQSLQTARFHIRREIADVDEKLARIQKRIQNKQRNQSPAL